MERVKETEKILTNKKFKSIMKKTRLNLLKFKKKGKFFSIKKDCSTSLKLIKQSFNLQMQNID